MVYAKMRITSSRQLLRFIDKQIESETFVDRGAAHRHGPQWLKGRGRGVLKGWKQDHRLCLSSPRKSFVDPFPHSALPSEHSPTRRRRLAPNRSTSICPRGGFDWHWSRHWHGGPLNRPAFEKRPIQRFLCSESHKILHTVAVSIGRGAWRPGICKNRKPCPDTRERGKKVKVPGPVLECPNFSIAHPVLQKGYRGVAAREPTESCRCHMGGLEPVFVGWCFYSSCLASKSCWCFIYRFYIQCVYAPKYKKTTVGAQRTAVSFHRQHTERRTKEGHMRKPAPERHDTHTSTPARRHCGSGTMVQMPTRRPAAPPPTTAPCARIGPRRGRS